MEESRNNRAVERRMKEALKNDRARIQIGRISHFGLLEMSRQRIRTGVLEGSTIICPHCAGVGTVRSTSSIALHVLRLLEDALIKSASHNITVRTRTEVALYILNQKRANLRDLERRFGVAITIAADDSLIGAAYHTMERGEPAVGVPELLPPPAPVLEAPEDEEDLDAADSAEDGEAEEAGGESAAGGEDEAGRRKRRRRRRRGRGGDREASGIPANAPQPSDDGLAYVAGIDAAPQPGAEPAEAEEAEGDEDERELLPPRNNDRPRRRRPRRRGRGGERNEAPLAQSEDGEPAAADFAAPEPDDLFAHELASDEAELHETPPAAEAKAPEASLPPAVEPQPEAPAAEPEREPEPEPEPDPNRPKRTGWWQRAKASLGG